MNRTKSRQYLGRKKDEKNYTLMSRGQRDSCATEVNIYVTDNAVQVTAGDYIVTFRATGYETVKINAQIIKAIAYKIIGTEATEEE